MSTVICIPMSPRGHKRTEKAIVKTTVELERSLWRAVKVRAVDEGTDLRGIIVLALQQYLAKKGARREE
ncbi:MAG: hypothetical protein HOO98_01215 [Nitrospira sp.]|nr:hypothetical protein [Nitrospira sp.]